MIRFSHTGIKNKEDSTAVVAVFTNKPETTGLATNFNFKASPGCKRGEMKLSLAQLDFTVAGAKDNDMARTLREGRKALIQRQRYEDHKMTAPPVDSTSAASI